MNFKKTLFFAFIFCASLSSCIKEIEIKSSDAGEAKNNIVLNHVFSSNKKDTFYLSYTYALHQAITYESDATIQMWEEQNFLTDLENFGNGRYKIPQSTNLNSDLPYTFKVLKNTEQLSVASDYLPKTITPDSAFFEIFPSPSGDDLIQFSFSFQDLPNEKQFYEVIFLNAAYDNQKDSTRLSFYSSARIPDLAVGNEAILEFEPLTFFFSDELFDGQRYQFDMQMEFSLNEGKMIKGKFQQGAEHDNFLIFRAISNNYFDFKKSWIKHRFNQVAQDTPNDIDIEILFPGEPAPLFSNVTNGYGIVAGYQETIIPIIER